MRRGGCCQRHPGTAGSRRTGCGLCPGWRYQRVVDCGRQASQRPGRRAAADRSAGMGQSIHLDSPRRDHRPSVSPAGPETSFSTTEPTTGPDSRPIEPRRMRITFLNPVGVVGGAERVLLAAIRGARAHLPEARLDVVLFADGPLEAEARRLGAAVTVVPLPACLAGLGDTRIGHGGHPTLAQLGLGWVALKKVPAAAQFVRRLRTALRTSAPDLIHSNGLKRTLSARLRGHVVFQSSGTSTTCCRIARL